MTGIVRGWLFLLAMAAASLSQSSVLELDSTQIEDKVFIAPYITLHAGSLPPNDVRAASELPDSDFRPVGTTSPLQPGQMNWFRFAIHNGGSSHRSLIVDFDQPVFSHLEWHEQTGVSERYILTGMDYAFDSRDIDYDFFAFRLEIPAGETVIVNFSIRSRQMALFIPSILDDAYFIGEMAFFTRMSGAVMGMLYSISFFMFLYLLFQPRSKMIQSMFIFSLLSMLSSLYVNGAIMRWLPDTEFPLRDAACVVIHGFLGMSFALVVRFFYFGEKGLRGLDKLLLPMIGLELLVIAMIPWLDIGMLSMAVVIINGVFMLSAIGLAISGFAHRQQHTYIFGVGMLIFIFMACVSVFGTIGLTPVFWLTRYGYELSLTAQVDFIFIAIISKLIAIQKEQLVSQEKIFRMNAEIKARTQFVDQVTHDLKSPLTAVLGAEELLREESDEGKRHRFLGIIRDGSQQVVSMINDMLDYSSLQRGTFLLQSQPVALTALLAQWRDAFTLMPRAAGVTFSLQQEEGLPDTIETDSLRLTQLFTNLVTNAFKFTEQGFVQVTVGVASRSADQVVVRFMVEDTGIGMSESFIQRAFEPYAREEERISGRRGFGLGLSICRQLVQVMDGTIHVDSTLGKGSCFTVELPFPLVR